MVDYEFFIRQLTASSIAVLTAAEQQAHRRGHNQLQPEHVIAAIADSEPSLFNEVLIKLSLDYQGVLREVEAKLTGHKNKKGGVGMSEGMRRLTHHALIQAHDQNRRKIEPEDFLQVYCIGKHIKKVMFERLIRMFGSGKA